MQDISTLVQKSLDGSATAAELKELLERLQQEENNMYAAWMLQQEGTKSEAGAVQPAFDKQGIKELINEKIQHAKPAPVKSLSPYRKLIKYAWPVTMAAAMLIAVLLVAGHLFNRNAKQAPGAHGQEVAAIEPEIMEAGTVQRTIVLKDSSLVLLYPGSSLQYDAAYNRKGRKLYLKGKGRFMVKKQPDQPFVVYSKHLSTTALGTVFEVQESKDSTVVSLIEGKVKVQDYTGTSARTVYLLAGQQATGYKDAGIAVARMKPDPALAQQNTQKKFSRKGKEGSLSFRQTPLVQVFEVLMKKYKVHISFDKQAVSGVMFTGSFEADEPVETILQVIASINKLEVQSSQQGYTISR